MPLFSILATQASSFGWFEYLPLIVTAICAVLLFVAFLIGFKKGGRRVSWGGCIWLTTAIVYFFLQYLLGPTLEDLLRPAIFGFSSEERVVAFAASFILAIVCILLSLLLYGIFSLAFPPKTQWLDKDGGVAEKDEHDIECDDDYEEDEDEKDDNSRSGYGRPTIFGRILGGIICALNTAAVLVVLLSVALLAIDATPLKDGAFAVLYNVPIVPTALRYASDYAFDLFFIGIILAFTRKGKQNGLLETLRSLLVSVGSLVALVVAFYLPFSAAAAPMEEGGDYFLNAFVTRCASMFSTLGLAESACAVFGKITAAILLAVTAILLIVLLNWVLKKAVALVERVGFLRAIDATLSCLVYLVIGVAVVALVWAIWYIFAHYGLFYANELFSEKASLSNGLFNVYEIYLEPYLTQLDEWFKSLAA